MTFDTLLHDQLMMISKRHDLYVCTNFEDNKEGTAKEQYTDSRQYYESWPNVRTFSLNLVRAISPLHDIVAILKFSRYLRQERVEIVHSVSPKAGLVSMLAGALGRVPIRIHTHTGQIWATRTGFMRFLLRSIDWIVSTAATHVYCDSDSQRKLLIREGVVKSDRISVIGDGSIGGVNLEKFDPNKFDHTVKDSFLEENKIDKQSIVIGFVGRVVVDKGINELVSVFASLSEKYNIALLIIGPAEIVRDQLPESTLDIIQHSQRIVHTGYVDDPERYLAICDIFCLPSYREGFGSVVIEAGAMGVPVVATRISGLVDAVDDDNSGILVEPRNKESLYTALELLVTNSKLREKLGRQGQVRANELFSADRVNSLVVDEYSKMYLPQK